MANAWVRMRHPDYDRCGRCSTTSAARCRSTPMSSPCTSRVVAPAAAAANAAAAPSTPRHAAGEPFPVVAAGTCTFSYRGPADSVRLAHFGVGLPADLDFEPAGRHRPLVPRASAVPDGSRLEYKLEVADASGPHLVEDPLNPRTAHNPFGANSVCEAAGYVTPDLGPATTATRRPDAR